MPEPKATRAPAKSKGALARMLREVDGGKELTSRLGEELLTQLFSVAAGGGADAVDRRTMAIAFARLMLRALESETTTRADMERATDAQWIAWERYRPSTRPRENDQIPPEVAKSAVEWLDAGRDALGRHGFTADAVAKALALASANSIPVERWTKALGEWRGETAAPKGRPKPGAYYWQLVIFRLITGSATTDPDDARTMKDALVRLREKRAR